MGNKMVVVVVGAAAAAAAAAVDGISVCSVSVASCGNMAVNRTGKAGQLEGWSARCPRPG